MHLRWYPIAVRFRKKAVSLQVLGILSLRCVFAPLPNVRRRWDKACFILSGIDEKGLLQSVDTAVEMNKNGDYGIPVPDYIEENVSTKVVKIIQSYTGVVNKMVWRK